LLKSGIYSYLDREIVFNHDDLNLGNIIGNSEGEIVAILDWDSAIARVPWEDASFIE
jgi:aminoglycoside phosphotransferase (APT) family kinase protein